MKEATANGAVSIQPFKPDAEFEPKQMEEAFKTALENEMSGDDGFVVPVSLEPAAPKAAAPIPAPAATPNKPVAKPAPTVPAAPVTQSEVNSPLGLLSKLKNSFATKETDEVGSSPAPVARRAPVAPTPEPAPMPRPVAEERPQPVARQDDPFAPKRASLDDNGRIMRPEASQPEDDQLEIPAFLRRQAN